MGKAKRYDEPKLNLKKVLGVLIALVVIVMFVISIKSLLEKSEKSTKELILNNQYFAIYENKKWGVIDIKGNIIITPTYDEMILIPDSTKPVFICTTEVNQETGTYKTIALNEKQQQIFNTYELVQAIDNYDDQKNIWYENNVLKVLKEGKYGLINFDGLQILKCEYDNIYSLKNVKNSIIIEKEGKLGLVNNIGEIIVKPEYKQIKALGKKYEDGYIVITPDNQYGIVDSNKRLAIETVFSNIKENVFGNDMYYVQEDDAWKVINKSQEDVLTSGFDDVISINLENIVIKKDNKYGVVNTSSAEVIPCQYDELKYAYGNIYIAKKDNKYGIINISNETKVDFIYDGIIYREDADFFESYKDEIETILIDTNFEVKLTGIISEVNTEDGYIKMRIDNENKYYNFKFEEKANTELIKGRTLFLSKKDNKYGFVDKNNNVVVDYIYEDATEQNKFGYAAIKKDGKWGSINQIGRVILEPSLTLENNLIIDFIEKWHLGIDLNMNYYTKD